MPNMCERSPVIKFTSVPEIRNSSIGVWTEGDDHGLDYSFGTERLKRYESSIYSPTHLQLKPAQKNRELILLEIVKLSIKSGLKYINAFEVISKLKLLAHKGITKLKVDVFVELICQMNNYKHFSSHELKTMKQYLNAIYKIFDPKS